MKSLFNTLLDGLTFKDIAGKRQPRTYTVLSGILLILIFALAACVALERHALMEAVQGTLEAVQLTVEPTATLEPTQAITETCPADPASWSFLDILPNDNFKRIAPACVYDGLGRSVAWAIAVRSGLTRAEAAQALGFTDFPMRRLNTVMALTDTKGPLPIAVSFTPPHPGFAEWRATDDGRLALVYVLRGCFRTSQVVGNRAEPWNTDYPVLCVLSEDSAGSQIIFQLDGYTFTSSAEPTRSFALFGYAGNGAWIWLGTQKEPKTSLATIPDFLKEATASAKLHNLPVWDAAWLTQTYGLLPKPLPENWRAMTQEADKQAILAGLNAFLNGVQP